MEKLHIHRHADRTPLQLYPNDPFKNITFWPQGFGQLSNNGKARMFNLGVHLRNEYKSFLANNPIEVYARSSQADRCINSVQLLLAGLYPPKNEFIWNAHFNWQPIAVYSKPINEDGVKTNN
ncbi:lysosomal acid phosphatase-like protein 3 [Leptotrombidium deliense]|uniref:acid phosphatase n=1 Tax=Leptotrombidium deliense TaxID=299467 RepID=A0A443S7C5_9ACAR|nr:lysosomal acid phosphatase-like protein 3 [Leptotrombidium deliense]